jgi:GDPmannose 4,6-dehydratase
MIALIFGASGQDGFYLTPLLQQQGLQVIAISRKGTAIQADVSDFNAVHQLVGAY